MLAAQELIQAAQAKTGLTDWGQGPDISYWLPLIVEEFNAVKAPEMIEAYWRRRFKTILCNRLELAKRMPTAQRFNHKPILITGPMRSGTTLLQRLLSLQPGLRAPTVAESLLPIAVAQGGETARLAYEKIEASCQEINSLVPAMSPMYPLAADNVEENRVLLEPSLMSHSFEAFAAPRYSQAINNASMNEAFGVMIRLLNLLDDGRRWVLKDPIHFGQIDNLTSQLPVYPVWIHRDPIYSIVSACSLTWQTQIKPPVASMTELGEQILADTKSGLIQLRHSAEYHNITHIDYNDFVRDPTETVKQVVALTGEDIEPSQMQKWLDNNPQHKYGVHKYRAEDFGLTNDMIRTELDGLW
jgi:hypothetical protein